MGRFLAHSRWARLQHKEASAVNLIRFVQRPTWTTSSCRQRTPKSIGYAQGPTVGGLWSSQCSISAVPARHSGWMWSHSPQIQHFLNSKVPCLNAPKLYAVDTHLKPSFGLLLSGGVALLAGNGLNMAEMVRNGPELLQDQCKPGAIHLA